VNVADLLLALLLLGFLLHPHRLLQRLDHPLHHFAAEMASGEGLALQQGEQATVQE
jgi:hypothetical protein